MMNKFSNKIAFKLTLLIIVGLLIGLLSLIFLDYIVKSHKFSLFFNKFTDDPSKTQLLLLIILGTYFLAFSSTFFGVFILGVNKRVKYLRYLTDSLKDVEAKPHLEALDVKGNDELAELAKSINIMSSRLKERFEYDIKVEQSKNEFIIAVSHDLKTPLTSIIGYLELIGRNKDCCSEENQKYLSLAYEKSINLKKLIDELFEYTKLANNYTTLQKSLFNINILVNQVVGEYIHFFNEKDISVEIDSKSQELWCEIDVQRMMRVIENIVKNAEKYSFRHTKFKVSMSEMNDEINIIFENAGDNMDKEELEKIFDNMYRLDKARTMANEGSGLGLAISKKIIELHGGRIWAECEGNNIKFKITLQKS